MAYFIISCKYYIPNHTLKVNYTKSETLKKMLLRES